MVFRKIARAGFLSTAFFAVAIGGGKVGMALGDVESRAHERAVVTCQDKRDVAYAFCYAARYSAESTKEVLHNSAGVKGAVLTAVGIATVIAL